LLADALSWHKIKGSADWKKRLLDAIAQAQRHLERRALGKPERFVLPEKTLDKDESGQQTLDETVTTKTTYTTVLTTVITYNTPTFMALWSCL
jgi:hypothetical protein